MSQQFVDNTTMSQRCEPMGGEIDEILRATSNIMPRTGHMSDIIGSSLGDNFVDDLALKVKSLLKSWDDDLSIENDPNNPLFSNEVQITEEKSFPDKNEEFCPRTPTIPSGIHFGQKKVSPHYQVQNELKYANSEGTQFDPNENLSRDFRYDIKNTDFIISQQQVDTRRLERLREKVVVENSISDDMMLSNSSVDNANKYLFIPRISVNEADQYDTPHDSARQTGIPCTQIQSVEEPSSYYSFSNTLQGTGKKAAVVGNRIPGYVSCEHQFSQTVIKSPSNSYGIEKNLFNKEQGVQKSHSRSNVAISTNMSYRDSSDKETERSWSEITVVAESFLEPHSAPVKVLNKNVNDLVNLNSLQSASLRGSPTIPNHNVQVKENLPSSRSPSIYNDAHNSEGVYDWRFRITDPERTCHKEYEFLNYCPISGLGDLDQVDRDTPPLSASSMASSKRLEWDNGADIGYSVVAVNSKGKHQRSVPSMARSEPEGISLINDTITNTGSTRIAFSSFTLPSSQDTSSSQTYSHFEDTHSKTSSAQDPGTDEDLFERSSSPGSLSRSDSKKSVIYNSAKDMQVHCKIQGSNYSSEEILLPMHKNSSWPDLTAKKSSKCHDWSSISPSKMLSRSEEELGSKEHFKSKTALKRFHFPGFVVSGGNADRSCYSNKSANFSQLPERIMPFGEHAHFGLQSVPKQAKVEDVSHCKSCQSPLSLNMSSSVRMSTNQRSDESLKLQEGDLNSYEFDTDILNSNQVNNTAQFSNHETESDWIDDNASPDPELRYITEIPELSDDQLQSFRSRPLFLLSNDSSKLKENNIASIVRSLFSNGNDHSVSGNLEVKPHIRWYPFASTPNMQDIKNVSTQTSMSFIAKQVSDSPVQVSGPHDNNQQILHRSSGLNLKSYSPELPDNLSNKLSLHGSSFPTASLSSNASVNDKVTPAPQFSIMFQPTKMVHTIPIQTEPVTSTSEVVSSNVLDGNFEQVNSESNHSKLFNYHKVNTSMTKNCQSFDGQMSRSRITSPLSTEITHDAEIHHHYLTYGEHSTVSNAAELNLNDLPCLSVKKAVDESFTSHTVSREQPTSLFERRVGVGQSQTPAESFNDEVSSAYPKILYSGGQSRVINLVTRGSSDASLNESRKEKQPNPPSSHENFSLKYSNSVPSRVVAFNQLDNHSTNCSQTLCSLEQSSDETIPLASNYREYNDGVELNEFSSFSTIPQERVQTPLEKNYISTDITGTQSGVASSTAKHRTPVQTSLSELLSHNLPMYISKHYDRNLIHKSHSDPIISDQFSITKLPSEESKIDFKYSRPCANIKFDSNFGRTNHKINSHEQDVSGRKYLINVTDGEETLKLIESQDSNISIRSPLKEMTPNTIFGEFDSFNSRNRYSDLYIGSYLSSHTLEHYNSSSKPLPKEQEHLPLKNETASHKESRKFHEYSDVTDRVQQGAVHDISTRVKDYEVERNFVSVGVQVSECVHGSQRCNFCHKTKDSHLNSCFKKEAFKTVLNHTLAKRLSELKSTCSKSGTSFCVFSSGCYCCCNKTLQEAFNFHRSELVERIEARKKDVEEKCRKKLLLYDPQIPHKQPVIKLRLKPVSDVSGNTVKFSSNKENYKNSKRKSASSWKNGPAQKGPQKNLSKYNRIMSKLYSQRLKSETLKGRVNYQRHEILINS